MSAGAILAVLDPEDDILICWQYQMISDWAKANAEKTICIEQVNGNVLHT